MLIKVILLLIALAFIKAMVYRYTLSQRRKYLRKKRPKDPTDTMNYDKVMPRIATIACKFYAFSSTAEYKYALSLQKQLENGEIAGWAYEETLFAFYPKPSRNEWKPDGVIRVVYPTNWLSVSASAKVKAYLPDFCITHINGKEEYVEIKGRFTARAKQALENMKVYHPKVKLTVKFVSLQTA